MSQGKQSQAEKYAFLSSSVAAYKQLHKAAHSEKRSWLSAGQYMVIFLFLQSQISAAKQVFWYFNMQLTKYTILRTEMKPWYKVIIC